MTETLSFPGLGLTFELSRVAFWIGEFPIYWYGITFATAFILGLCYFHFSARRVGIHPYEGLDAILWAIIGGVIGARAYFVIFQWEAMYKANPIKIFAFREGGLAIYGGVIGAILVGLIACRMKKLPPLPMLDVGLPALLLGQAIGRWGNFFNIEAFGGNTDLPWGMTSKSIETFLARPEVVDELAKLGQTVNPFVPVHPTFFYEFLWNLLGFLVLAFVLTPRRRYDGQVTLWYMAWYGLGRAFIEGLRTDSLVTATPWGMIRVSQYLAIAGFVASVILLIVLGRKARSENRPAWMGLFADSEASAALMCRGDEAMNASKR
ncbi:MAG: prolipoprotein diacylglyceryl transferase, partial [Angelakisella sp.]